MKEQNKPIVWILGIILVVLLFMQVSPSNTLYSIDNSNQCTVGEQKCCDRANLYCTDGTGSIQFKCEQLQGGGGIWVNYGSKPSCVSTQQICSSGAEKCNSQNYLKCQNNLWVLQGMVPGKCGVAGTTPKIETPETPQNTETPTETPAGTITIPIVNVQVTTTQAVTGGVGILFLLFLLL